MFILSYSVFVFSLFYAIAIFLLSEWETLNLLVWVIVLLLEKGLTDKRLAKDSKQHEENTAKKKRSIYRYKQERVKRLSAEPHRVFCNFIVGKLRIVLYNSYKSLET